MPKFKLRAKVEKLDDVAELFRPAYLEKDGAFSLDPEKLEGIEFDDKAELAGALKKEREARARLEPVAKKAEKFTAILDALADADDDEIAQFVEGWGKRGEVGNNGGGKIDPDKDKTALELKIAQKELKKAQDQLKTVTEAQEKADRELKDYRLWTPLREMAIKSGVVPEDWELARLDLGSKGQFGFDDDGKVVVLEDGAPSTISPEKFFKEVYVDQRPKFYRASGAGGSGATNGTKGTNGQKTYKRSELDSMSPQAAMTAMKEVGAGKAQLVEGQ